MHSFQYTACQPFLAICKCFLCLFVFSFVHLNRHFKYGFAFCAYNSAESCSGWVHQRPHSSLRHFLQHSSWAKEVLLQKIKATSELQCWLGLMEELLIKTTATMWSFVQNKNFIIVMNFPFMYVLPIY